MKPITEATRRNVWVETDKMMGSGIIIQTGIVLTNFHVLEVDSTIMVDEKEAEILVVAPQLDLMLLKVDTKHVSPIRICTEVEIGEEVFYVANPKGGPDVAAQPVELYDLEADIGEKTNLAAQNPGVVARLRSLAEAHCRALGGTFGKPLSAAAKAKKPAE